jgi:hypothetical protein
VPQAQQGEAALELQVEGEVELELQGLGVKARPLLEVDDERERGKQWKPQALARQDDIKRRRGVPSRNIAYT